MICATRGGDGWLWYGIGAVVLVFGGRSRFKAVEASGAAALIAVALFLTVKRLTGRARPCAIEPHCWATLLPPDRFSFPSGHAMSAFAVALPLGLFYNSLLPGLLFCVCSIALSRVLLGMHFLSDVIAGSLLGTGLGYLAWNWFR